MKLNVYIPAPDHYTPIDPGSGIVGVPTHDADGKPSGSVVVDFESNRFGAANIVTWADRLYHAASRHLNRYPTTARALLPAASLIWIGTYEENPRVGGLLVVNADCEALLARWLMVEPEKLRAEMFRS